MQDSKPTSNIFSPLFSVIIPTRNRPQLLVSAVVSVLNQSFTNYELIVSDNSDEPNETQRIVTGIPGWSPCERLRYVTPDRYMSMVDHWEFATQHARGEYVAILTDRFVMRPSALQVLESVIRDSSDHARPEIISWNVPSGYSELTRLQNCAPFSGAISSVMSSAILEEFVQFSAWNSDSMFSNWLPRGLNSVYRRSLAEKIIRIHGRVFFPLSPDYTSAFLFLIYSNTLLRLSLPLYLCHGTQSNGQQSATFGIALHAKDYLCDPYENCPLRIDTVLNTLARDYLFIKKMVSNHDLPEIDMVGYFLSNYRELLLKEQWGSPMNMQEIYTTWSDGVATLTIDQRRKISDGLLILDSMHPKLIRVRQLTLKYNLYHHCRDALDLLRRLRGIIKREPFYADVIQAAQETDYYIHK